MGDKLRLAVGIMGNAASLLLYSAPILTFKRVVERKSTEEFSCIPYIIALLNCLLYTWYGLPIVSYGWENFPVVTINGLGILLEFSFILAYLWFASAKGKASYLDFLHKVDNIKVAVILVPVILAFSIISAVSAFVLHDHHLRKVFVGTVGVVASAAMYSSPLVAMVSQSYSVFLVLQRSFPSILKRS
ncbi:Bidirectional sugar transporter SWEET3 [Linum perenne]